jgi:hypothetical protein
MMKMFRAALMAALVFATAMPASAGKMNKAKGPVTVAPGMATVVFMRPGKFVGAAVAVPVWDVTLAEPKFVGIVDAGGKVAYSVAPGEHIFMTTVFGGDAGVRFQKATVEAGKTYYFHAHIIQGIWGLEPVRAAALGGSEFAEWDKGTKLLENSPKSLAWAEETLADAKRKSGLKPAAVPEQNSLNVEDGR